MAASEPQGIWTQAGSLGTSIPFLPRGCEGNEIVDLDSGSFTSALELPAPHMSFHDSEQGPVNLISSEAAKQLKVSPGSLTPSPELPDFCTHFRPRCRPSSGSHPSLSPLIQGTGHG